MQEDNIFVFGSNLAGIHGAGAAKLALQKYGAKWFVGEGLQGNSYALPTKDYNIKTLPLTAIEAHVKKFAYCVVYSADRTFYLTPIGCGLAGYRRDQIRPILEKYDLHKMPNVVWAESWNDKDIN